MESVSTSMQLLPENLPPTERALTFHAYRVHLQVAQWKALSLDCLNPLEWGWFQKDGIIAPVSSSSAAPYSSISGNKELSVENFTCARKTRCDQLEPTDQLLVRRDYLVVDAISWYKDPSTINSKLFVKLLDEDVEDLDGVTREFFSSFWHQFQKLYGNGEYITYFKLHPEVFFN